MRLAVRPIVLLDGTDRVKDNLAGRLAAFMTESGFTAVVEFDPFRTAFGPVRLYRATKPCSRWLQPAHRYRSGQRKPGRPVSGCDLARRTLRPLGARQGVAPVVRGHLCQLLAHRGSIAWVDHHRRAHGGPVAEDLLWTEWHMNAAVAGVGAVLSARAPPAVPLFGVMLPLSI